MTVTTSPMTDADSVDALAVDGGIVTIRPVHPTDRRGLAALHGDATPDSLRLRFFVKPSAASLAAEIDRLCLPEDGQHLAVLAVEGSAVVGVASAERTDDTGRRAEFSVFVAGPHRGRGIGTLLLEHLAARARRRGISKLIGEVLPDNIDMLRTARDLNAHAWSRFGDGIVDVGLDTSSDDTAAQAADLRNRTAERASLRALLAPASVAVVGAGHRPGSVGHETLRGLREHGFTGPLYAVNRSGAPVAGAASHRSVKELPPPVELLVIAVPADQVAQVLADGATVGVRAAVILSAGFGEDGPDGRRRQEELVRFARQHGIRLVGPNCLGVINTDPNVRLDASFAPHMPFPGGLAVAAQSGAVGIALLEDAIRSGHGISTFVSLGNKADVSGNDLIAYWYDDPATRAVALYLESFGNPRKFARTVRALGRRKPVLALKSGRSGAGQRAGASHTAAAVVIGQDVPATTLGSRRAPVYTLPERAVRALAHAVRYAEWRRQPLGSRPDLPGVDTDRTRSAVAAALAGGTGWQSYERTTEILTGYGIATLPAVIATSSVDAVAAAGRLGYPVVLKSADPDLVHKTDTGGVRLGLTGPDAVREAFDAVAAAGRPSAGVLVQKQVAAPVELVAGVVHDPLFGSVVLLGLGGVHTDLLGDRTLRLVPMTDLDAGRMWRGLRAAPLLTGYRGAPPVDTTTLEDLLLRLGRLAEDIPEIAELDLNPVLAGPDGVVAVDAKLRLAPVSAEPDPTLRRLS